MRSVTLCGGAAYYHARPPTYLVLPVPKYACHATACPRKYFTPPITEAAPDAHTSRPLQHVAVRRYRRGTATLRVVAREVRRGAGGLLHRHGQIQRAALAPRHAGHRLPGPERLPFSSVLCMDEVYDHGAGKRVPTWTCVDPLAAITIRIPIERADAASLAAAMQEVNALGAAPTVIVSDLWAAYPQALAQVRPQVWPRAARQRCWFHVLQWVTRKVAAVLKAYGEPLGEDDRQRRTPLRACAVASWPVPRRSRVSARRAGSAPAPNRRSPARGTACAVPRSRRGTAVEEAVRLRDDLRAVLTVLNESTSRTAARARFDALRQTWPPPFRPQRGGLDGWRPGQPFPPPPKPPPPPKLSQPAPPEGLQHYLHEIMAFFVAHFEQMIPYLDHPGVPRTNNHSERANRRSLPRRQPPPLRLEVPSGAPRDARCSPGLRHDLSPFTHFGTVSALRTTTLSCLPGASDSRALRAQAGVP